MHREDKGDSDKNKVFDIVERDTWYFFIITYQWWIDMHTINSIFFLLGKIKRQGTEILISNLDMLKQLETMWKDWSLNLIIKLCLNTLEIFGHFQSKDTVPGSSPIQTIWKWKNNNRNTLSLTLLWWIEAKFSNNTLTHVSFGSVFDGKQICTYWRRHHLQ